jgi:DNA-binding LytR/AlgR family response regulator
MEKISVRNEKEIRIIRLENLIAITVENYLSTFIMEDVSCFSCTQSLKETLPSLPNFFIQINRNCIVNANKIKSIDLKNKQVLMQNDLKYSVSLRNIKALKKYFQNDRLKNKNAKC